jgi:hypothetical protein
MEFKVVAELESHGYMIGAVSDTIFFKQITIELPESTILDRAFNEQHGKCIEIKVDGLDLAIARYENPGTLIAVGLIGRYACSDRVFARLKELGWIFKKEKAESMHLPARVGPLDDAYLWEKLMGDVCVA